MMLAVPELAVPFPQSSLNKYPLSLMHKQY